MKKTSLLFVASALLCAAPLAAQESVYLGPTLAWHDDVDLGIGATVGFDMPSMSERVGFMGDFIYFFPDGFDYWEINGNATYDFPLEDSSVMPFALAGLNISRTSVDIEGFGDASSTDLHLNLGGGIAFDANSFRPRLGARFVIGDGSALVVFATLPFGLGGA